MLPASILAAGFAGAAARIYWPETVMPAVTPNVRNLLEMEFEELAFPKGDVQHEVAVSDAVTIDGMTYDIKYEVLARSGDVFGDHTFGLMLDDKMKALRDEDGKLMISHGADFSSFLPFGDKIYMVTHFESPTPAISYFSELEQDRDGYLKMVSTEPMNWSKYEGLWVPCAGSVTPWKTHFGSEEYEPEARSLYDLIAVDPEGTEWTSEWWASYVLLYKGLPETLTNKEVEDKFHFYLYGYPWEAVVSPSGDYSVVKHMAMGRLAIELPYVMPDLKTVYITDDGTNKMVGVFVSEKAGDMSCGTLYGAKFNQRSADNAGTFDIDWVKVGPTACDSDLEAIAMATKFADIFEVGEPNEDASCPQGFTSINAQYYHECLKLKPDMELAASRFEFRRYAAMLGATTEFSKWEGITYDNKRERLYTAMSEVRYGMEDFAKKGETVDADGVAYDKYDKGGSNDIRVEYNKCGCVYAMDVDTDTYLAKNMYALVCGDPESNTDEFNSCNKDGIANPDNIAYIVDHDGLIIGEDTGSGHQNDVLWYYNFEEKSLTRMLSTPYGSETTSPYFYPNINGYAYVTGVVQHPYGESDEDKADEPKATGLSAWVGYIGPFKAHPDSVNMAEHFNGEMYWNGWVAEESGMGGY